MFRISNYHKMDMSCDDAVALMKNVGRGDLLKGLENIQQCWDDLVMSDDMDDDQFYSDYIYEVNAFNVVYEGMADLFRVKNQPLAD